ncbi:ABC transporter permease [Catenulispora pinisilvae]|uniref:ABC transporter permease n=1 Tax=Catenulispora pinisilvae TaxID=2705253 RepID=UPI001E60FA48|nr:ABC transporter permease subunit [Catenulispora pinisilvae]
MAVDVTGRASRRRPATARPTPVRASWRTRLNRDKVLWLMMAPGIAYFAVFQYAAQLGNVIAFKDYVPFIGINGSAWVGLQNFTTLFHDPAFWHAVANSLELAGLQLVFFFPVPLALALLLHSLTRAWVRKLVVSVVYLPHFISWVIVAGLFVQVLGPDGMVNGLVTGGGHQHLVNVFGDPAMFKPMMIVELIWKDCGWGTIIFLAALYQVDDSLYEAVSLDGAGWGRRHWHVTLPSIRPVIVLLLILRVGDILSVGFDQVMQQRASFGPQASEVIDTYIYYHGVQDGNFSTGAVAGLFKGVVALILVLAANKIAHKLGEQGIYQ